MPLGNQAKSLSSKAYKLSVRGSARLDRTFPPYLWEQYGRIITWNMSKTPRDKDDEYIDSTDTAKSISERVSGV